MRKTLFALAFLASAISIPLTAHADAIDQITFNFSTPPFIFPANLVIDLPASPPPSPYTFQGMCSPFNCFDVVGTSGGFTYILDFTQRPEGQGTLVEYATFLPADGPPDEPRAYRQFLARDLFTGSLSNPTFLTGTFDATYLPLPIPPAYSGTITIEPLTNSTVPEPSSFALMTTGILGAITTLRHRKSMSRFMSRSRTS